MSCVVTGSDVAKYFAQSLKRQFGPGDLKGCIIFRLTNVSRWQMTITVGSLDAIKKLSAYAEYHPLKTLREVPILHVDM